MSPQYKTDMRMVLYDLCFMQNNEVKDTNKAGNPAPKHDMHRE